MLLPHICYLLITFLISNFSYYGFCEIILYFQAYVSWRRWWNTSWSTTAGWRATVAWVIIKIWRWWRRGLINWCTLWSTLTKTENELQNTPNDRIPLKNPIFEICQVLKKPLIENNSRDGWYIFKALEAWSMRFFDNSGAWMFCWTCGSMTKAAIVCTRGVWWIFFLK